MTYHITAKDVCRAEDCVLSDCCQSLAVYRINMDDHRCLKCGNACEVTTCQPEQWDEACVNLRDFRMKKVS